MTQSAMTNPAPAPATAAATAAARPASAQYVTLGVEQEIFAVDVALVHEILDVRPISRIPNAPAHLLGMIDVRRRTVPVIDLRTKLGLPPIPPSLTTRIVVLDVPLNGRMALLGLLADRVYEVTPLSEHSLEEAPDIGVRWRSQFIKGVGRRNGKFVIVLDVGRLFGSDEPMLLESAAPPAPAQA